jgi:hypothetical protein
LLIAESMLQALHPTGRLLYLRIAIRGWLRRSKVFNPNFGRIQRASSNGGPRTFALQSSSHFRNPYGHSHGCKTFLPNDRLTNDTSSH